MKRRRPAARGFTAVEVVTVFALLAVLAGLLLAGLRSMRRTARLARAERLVVSADLAARAHRAAHGSWPAENRRRTLDRRLAERLARYGFSADGAGHDGPGGDAAVLDPWGGAYRYDVADEDGDADIPGRRTRAFWAARGVEGVRVFSAGAPDGGGARHPDRYIYPPGRDEGAPEGWFDRDGLPRRAHRGPEGGLAPASRAKLLQPGGGWRRWRRA